jgi:heme-degrading monooxygenase HmoA
MAIEYRSAFRGLLRSRTPAQGFDRYLAIAGSLRPALYHIPGFESIERSRSVNSETRLLSLSYWGNQAAVAAWRSHGAHHEAQIVGRNELFVD